MPARIVVGVVSAFGLAVAATLFLYAVSPWADHQEIPFFGSRIVDIISFGVMGLLCVFVSIRLSQGRAWAWWTVLTANLVLMGLGGSLFLSALYPRDDFARSESGFGLGVGIIAIIPAAISIVLLSLPFVRRYCTTQHVRTIPTEHLG